MTAWSYLATMVTQQHGLPLSYWYFILSHSSSSAFCLSMEHRSWTHSLQTLSAAIFCSYLHVLSILFICVFNSFLYSSQHNVYALAIISQHAEITKCGSANRTKPPYVITIHEVRIMFYISLKKKNHYLLKQWRWHFNLWISLPGVLLPIIKGYVTSIVLKYVTCSW